VPMIITWTSVVPAVATVDNGAVSPAVEQPTLAASAVKKSAHLGLPLPASAVMGHHICIPVDSAVNFKSSQLGLPLPSSVMKEEIVPAAVMPIAETPVVVAETAAVYVASEVIQPTALASSVVAVK